MSLEQKEELEKEMRRKVLEELQGDQALANLLLTTLKNFSYRYLESDHTGELEPVIEEGRLFIVRAEESNTVEILKAANKETKKILITKAKKNGKEGITAKYHLSIKMLDHNNAGGGIFALEAKISCEGENMVKSSTCEYEDIIDLRNKLAKDLEDVCQVY